MTFNVTNGEYTWHVPTDDTKYHKSTEETVTIDGADASVTVTVKQLDDPPEPETYTLTATILSPDGEPVEDMDVGLSTYPDGEDVATKTTDANGQVTFKVESGGYELAADVSESPHTEYGTHLVTVNEDTEYTINLDTPPGDDGGTNESESDSDNETDAGNETDANEPETETLTVMVTDPNDEPVVGETVHIVTYDSGADVASGETDENGQATFELESGEYEVVVSPPDQNLYQPSDQRFVDIRDEDVEFNVQLQAPSQEPDAYTLTVMLANDDVDGVEVEVWRALPGGEESEKVTKESQGGEATFELEPGHYYVDAEGYVGTLSAVDVTDGDIEITLQNESGTTVPIKATDAETGEPIAGAEITGICHLNYSTGEVPITGTTDEDGVAQAHADVTPTWCTGVRISADGYEDEYVDINVPMEGTVKVELTPRRETETETVTAAKSSTN